jgi:hypothetical protein
MHEFYITIWVEIGNNKWSKGERNNAWKHRLTGRNIYIDLVVDNRSLQPFKKLRI